MRRRISYILHLHSQKTSLMSILFFVCVCKFGTKSNFILKSVVDVCKHALTNLYVPIYVPGVFSDNVNKTNKQTNQKANQKTSMYKLGTE